MLSTKIVAALRAGFGGLRLITRDEESLMSEIRAPLLVRGQLLVWSTASGLWEQKANKPLERVEANMRDPWEFLLGIRQRLEGRSTITMILAGVDTIMEREPVLRRAFVEAVRFARARGHLLILLSRSESTHPEIGDEITSFWHELPPREASAASLQSLLTRYQCQAPDVDRVLDAAQGLTLSRMSDAFALALIDAKDRQAALVQNGVVPAPTALVDASIVREYKESEIGKRSFLKIAQPRITFNDLIGHDYLKSWLGTRRSALSPAARAAGLPAPKGILFVGPPGTGKSRFVEATAHEWGVPWLTLDTAGLYGSLLGESEARLTEAIEIAERMSPCILHIDEVERGFSTSDGDRDGGTQERVLGKMLTWMASKTAPVFVVMTSNFADRLPAALTRKGRLDEMFFLDFPSASERQAIFEHFLSKADHTLTPGDVQSLVNVTDQWSPSEIEAVVLDARFTAFSQNRKVAVYDVNSEVEKTVPVSKSYQTAVERMRTWAQTNARRTSYETSEQYAVNERMLRA